MKGIILAGGLGTRLYPLTIAVSKQLLPVYDKPMIYYPLSTLMLAGIREILIISTPKDIERFKELFGTGEQIGIKLSYEVQDKPRGIAEAFVIGKEFIADDDIALILGDNIFIGNELKDIVKSAANDILKEKGALVFGYEVDNPQEFGVVNLENGRIISIEEKPKFPKSNYCIPGLYFYDNKVTEIVDKIKPSNRGELEITDINKIYLENDNLKIKILDNNIQWLDAGSNDNLVEAANIIKNYEELNEEKIAYLEEIAYSNGWINKEKVIEACKKMCNSKYGQYLSGIIENI